MDIREKNKTTEEQKKKVTEEELNDSLIFNIMKKIELREFRLIEEYKIEKEQMNKKWYSKHFIHSEIPVYYAGLIALNKLVKIIYMKPGARPSTVITIPNLLFHICVVVSLNEYYKYQNIFNIRHELGEEYRLYQKNVETLMDEKIANFSLAKKLAESNIINQDNLMQTLKYRLVI